MKNKLFIGLILSLIFIKTGFGQGMPQVEMADALRENGKIYVVVIIMSIIFVGIAAYLINLDRKISKLEKKEK